MHRFPTGENPSTFRSKEALFVQILITRIAATTSFETSTEQSKP